MGLRALGVLVVGMGVGCGGGAGGGETPADGGSLPDRVERGDAGSRGGAIVDARLRSQGDARVAHVDDAGRPKDSGKKLPEAAPEAAMEAAPAPITVTGSVTDEAGNAVAGRAINALDGAGVSHVELTDALGDFTMPGVTTPYALAVTAAPGDAPVVYAGLSTSKPRLLTMTSPPSAPGSSASLGFTVNLPDCGGNCTVLYAAFADGAGAGSSGPFTYASPASVSAAIDVQWPGSSPASAGVHVLVANAAFTSFWYAKVADTLSNGVAVVAGTITPAPTPTAATLTLTGSAIGLAPGWTTPSTYVELDYAGGGAVTLASAPTSLLSIGVPDVVGGTLSAGASAMDTVEAGVDVRQRAYAAVTGLALTTPAATATMYAPATWTVPSTSSSTASVSLGASLAWTPPSAAPAGFDLLLLETTAPPALLGYVVTADTSVPLPDLVKLGVPLAPGGFAVELIELRPEPTLDAALEAGDLYALLEGQGAATLAVSTSTVVMSLTP